MESIYSWILSLNLGREVTFWTAWRSLKDNYLNLLRFLSSYRLSSKDIRPQIRGLSISWTEKCTSKESATSRDFRNSIEPTWKVGWHEVLFGYHSVSPLESKFFCSDPSAIVYLHPWEQSTSLCHKPHLFSKEKKFKKKKDGGKICFWICPHWQKI